MPAPTQGRPGIPLPAQRAAELTELGGFAVFQVETEGLIRLATALEAQPLADRFAATRAGLAAGSGLALEQVPPRTAVSAAQVGLVSRCWSIALASVALHDWIPDLSAEQLLVGPGHRNPGPMALADPGAGRPAGELAETVIALTDLVLHGAVAAVTEACATQGRTSRTVLVSNAASALVASTRVVGRAAGPRHRTRLDALTRALLEVPWLAAGGGFDHQQFKRTGCCLYYRLPGHGLCPDCVLVRPGHPADEHH